MSLSVTAARANALCSKPWRCATASNARRRKTATAGGNLRQTAQDEAGDPLDVAYAARLRVLSDAHPDDADIASLYAEAVMVATRTDWSVARPASPPAPSPTWCNASKPPGEGTGSHRRQALPDPCPRASPQPERAVPPPTPGRARAGIAAPGAHARAHLCAYRALCRCGARQRAGADGAGRTDRAARAAAIADQGQLGRPQPALPLVRA